MNDEGLSPTLALYNQKNTMEKENKKIDGYALISEDQLETFCNALKEAMWTDGSKEEIHETIDEVKGKWKKKH